MLLIASCYWSLLYRSSSRYYNVLSHCFVVTVSLLSLVWSFPFPFVSLLLCAHSILPSVLASPFARRECTSDAVHISSATHRRRQIDDVTMNPNERTLRYADGETRNNDVIISTSDILVIQCFFCILSILGILVPFSNLQFDSISVLWSLPRPYNRLIQHSLMRRMTTMRMLAAMVLLVLLLTSTTSTMWLALMSMSMLMLVSNLMSVLPCVSTIRWGNETYRRESNLDDASCIDNQRAICPSHAIWARWCAAATTMWCQDTRRPADMWRHESPHKMVSYSLRLQLSSSSSFVWTYQQHRRIDDADRIWFSPFSYFLSERISIPIAVRPMYDRRAC